MHWLEYDVFGQGQWLPSTQQPPVPLQAQCRAIIGFAVWLGAADQSHHRTLDVLFPPRAGHCSDDHPAAGPTDSLVCLMCFLPAAM